MGHKIYNHLPITIRDIYVTTYKRKLLNFLIIKRYYAMKHYFND